MDKNKVLGAFQSSWLGKSQEYISNPSKTKDLLKKATGLLSKAGLKGVAEEIEIFIDFVGDVMDGKYKNYNKMTLVWGIGALIYLVSPVDVIPDFILGLGFADDAAVISFAFSQIRSDLQKYRNSRR